MIASMGWENNILNKSVKNTHKMIEVFKKVYRVLDEMI